MKITLLLTGKTRDLFIRDGFAIYEKRLSYYIFFETIIIPDLKSPRNLDAWQVKEKIVRLLFMEQLYRAFTIISNEPYHHEG